MYAVERLGNRMEGVHNLTTQELENKKELEYEDAIRTLNLLQCRPKAAGAAPRQAKKLEDTCKFLSRCGVDVQQLDDLCVIHVAGTKGKGSTCAFCESILRHHGYKTGFFSSPHLVAVRERIRINGRPLSRKHFSHHFWKVYNALDNAKENAYDMPTYFKFLTVMAFQVFLAEKVDVAIVEVGIGGEYDCTNILRHVSAVGITSLGIDHVKVLGNTVEEIAWHKAGIMKPGAIAFTSSQQPESALKVLKQRAMEKQCPLLIAPPLDTYDWGQFPMELGIDAPSQVINASLALQLANAWMLLHSTNNGLKKPLNLSACDVLNILDEHKSKWPVMTASTFPITDYLASGLKLCTWPGRTQVLEDGHLRFFLDGAHTAESMTHCSGWFEQSSRKHCEADGEVTRRVLLFNSTGDRNTTVLLSPLLRNGFTHIFFCPNLVTKKTDLSSDQANRKVTEEQVTERCRQNEEAWLHLNGGGEVKQFACVLDVLTELRQDPEPAHVLVTGSLHLVGDLLSLVDPELEMSLKKS